MAIKLWFAVWSCTTARLNREIRFYQQGRFAGGPMKVNTALSHHKALDYGSSERSTRSGTKRARANQRIPKWAYLLFILLAGFVTYRILQHRATEVKAAQAPARPASVAKV